MMLIELIPVPAEALPVAEFRDHLRLGSGFAEEGAEDGLLMAFLRAAMTAIEAKTAKALISRDFTLTLRGWRDPARQPLPVAPISAVTQVVQIDAVDSEVVTDAGTWRLITDAGRPFLQARGACLPAVPVDGAVRIAFTAGYGPTWSDVPADLAQAVMLLAATYYEYRAETGDAAEIMPHGVRALLAPYRALRLGGGDV